MSKNDMALMDKYTQRFDRVGTSVYIRTYLNGTELVHEHECQNVGQTIPTEINNIAQAILAQIALGQVTAETNTLTGVSVFSKEGAAALIGSGVRCSGAYTHSAYYSGFNLQPKNWNPGGRFSLAVLGDSIGEGAWSSVTQSQWNVYGWVAKTKAALVTMGYIDGGEGFIPMHRADWVKVGTWTQIADNGPSGNCWSATSDATKTYTLTTTTACDNADIIYIDAAGAGDFTVTVDGGAPVTIVPPKLANNKTIATNVSLGALTTHTILIKAPVSGTLYLNGAAIYRGSSGIVFNNLSKSGATSNDFGYKADTRLALLSVLKPRLTLYAALANDYGSAQTPISTYNSRTDLVAIEANRYGSIIGICPPDNGLSTAGKTITLAEYEAAFKNRIIAGGGGVLDIHAAWGAYAENASKMYDTQHPNATGHLAISALVTQLCMSLGA